MSKLPNIQIRDAEFPGDKEVVGQLFKAYAQSLPVSLDFQNFDHELAELPGKYASEKGGALWLLCRLKAKRPASAPQDRMNRL